MYDMKNYEKDVKRLNLERMLVDMASIVVIALAMGLGLVAILMV